MISTTFKSTHKNEKHADYPVSSSINIRSPSTNSNPNVLQKSLTYSEEDKTKHTFIFWTSDGNCEIKIAKLSRIVFASLIAFSLNILQCVCTMISYHFKYKINI